MLPSSRILLGDGIPCTISSSIEMHNVLGNPYSPLNDGAAPSWLRMNRSASASRSSVLMPGRRTSRIRASVPATIRPARPMMSISRGDLSVIMLLGKSLSHSFSDFLNRSPSGNMADQISSLVPVEHGCGLLSIGLEPDGDGTRIVVGPLLHVAALG